MEAQQSEAIVQAFLYVDEGRGALQFNENKLAISKK